MTDISRYDNLIRTAKSLGYWDDVEMWEQKKRELIASAKLDADAPTIYILMDESENILVSTDRSRVFNHPSESAFLIEVWRGDQKVANWMKWGDKWEPHGNK